jgi:Fibronectin type III domain
MRSLRGWALPTGADTTDARRNRPATRRRVTAGAAITAIVSATLIAGSVAPANASLVGPMGTVDTVNGFPMSFDDGELKLGQCLSGPQCIANVERPNPGAAVSFPNNFPSEIFWYGAFAETPDQPGLYEAALEGAFTSADGSVEDRTQQAFARLRFQLQNLVPRASYTIQHPYGTHTFVAEVDPQDATLGFINFTDDVGCELQPCDFAMAKTAFMGSFLKQSNPVAGFIGNLLTTGTVTGAPSGLNKVIVTGPRAGGVDDVTGLGIDTLTVDQFNVQGEKMGQVAVPSAPSTPTVTAGNNSALVRWSALGNGGSSITQYSVQAFNAAGTLVGSKLITAAARTSANSVNFTGLTNQAYTFKVTAKNALGFGALSGPSTVVRPRTLASFPVILKASPGAVGGAVTARANWMPPASTGGTAITGYVVTAMRINTRGSVMTRTNSVTQHFSVRSLSMTLPAGNYRFAVRARNALGMGAYSTSSQVVTAR